MQKFFSSYTNHLKKTYPGISPDIFESLSPQLASPFVVSISQAQMKQAENIVNDLWKLQNNSVYQKQILQKFPFAASGFAKTPSVLCSLDVHINDDGDLKIIEINTNASSFLVNAEHSQSRSLHQFPNAKQKLKESFQKAFGSLLKPGNLFLIVDDKPEQQNMYFEFLMYREFLKKEFGVECEIAAPQELVADANQQIVWNGRKVSGIYNRHTDFYFAESPAMAKGFQNEATLFSPNPWGYALIADKNRLVEWNDDFFASLQKNENLSLPFLQKALLKTYHFSDFKDADDLWAQRNRFFFKPPNAYGSRSVYKGKSISRTVYQRIYTDGYLAQEAVPAPEVKMTYENQEHVFKYDLRFYFFEDQIHLAVARLYQGQLTNLQTPLGGLAPLEIR
jgi:hypothetical protein